MKKRLSILLSVLLMTGCANGAYAPNGSDVSGSSDSSVNSPNPDNPDNSLASYNSGGTEKGTESSDISDGYSAFNGIALSEKDADDYSTINNKTNTPQLFCCGGETIYFSNPDDGFTLYSYDGKTAARLTDTAVCSLNYYDGSVYFLQPENAGPLDTWLMPARGCPYRYDIESAAVTKLSDTPVSNLRADGNGIFCTRTDENGETAVYGLDPRSGEPEYAYRGFGVQNIGGYVLTNRLNGNDGLDTLFVKGDEEIAVLSGAVPLYDCIHKGIYYYRDGNDGWTLHSVDLGGGKTAELERCADYTVLGDRLFLIKKGMLYLSAAGGALPVLVGALTTGDPSAPTDYGYYFEQLYTRGDELYAIVSYGRDRCSFARVNMSADAEAADVTLIG